MGAVDRGKFNLPSFLVPSSDLLLCYPLLSPFIISFIGAEFVKASQLAV